MLAAAPPHRRAQCWAGTRGERVRHGVSPLAAPTAAAAHVVLRVVVVVVPRVAAAATPCAALCVCARVCVCGCVCVWSCAACPRQEVNLRPPRRRRPRAHGEVPRRCLLGGLVVVVVAAVAARTRASTQAGAVEGNLGRRLPAPTGRTTRQDELRKDDQGAVEARAAARPPQGGLPHAAQVHADRVAGPAAAAGAVVRGVPLAVGGALLRRGRVLGAGRGPRRPGHRRALRQVAHLPHQLGARLLLPAGHPGRRHRHLQPRPGPAPAQSGAGERAEQPRGHAEPAGARPAAGVPPVLGAQHHLRDRGHRHHLHLLGRRLRARDARAGRPQHPGARRQLGAHGHGHPAGGAPAAPAARLLAAALRLRLP